MKGATRGADLCWARSCLTTVKTLYQSKISLKTTQLSYYVSLAHCSPGLKIIWDSADQKIRQDPLFHQVRQKKNFQSRWIWEIALAYGGKPITSALTSHGTVGLLQGLDFHLKSPFWDSIAAYFGDARLNLRCYLAKSHYLFHFLLQPINLQCWGGGDVWTQFHGEKGENRRNNSQIMCPTLARSNVHPVA